MLRKKELKKNIIKVINASRETTKEIENENSNFSNGISKVICFEIAFEIMIYQRTNNLCRGCVWDLIKINNY